MVLICGLGVSPEQVMEGSSGETPKPRERRMLLSAIQLAPIGLQHYLVLGAVLFVSGLLTILVKRNAIGILMGVELILNAANVNLVAFNAFSHGGGAGGIRLDGQVFAIFVIVLAAAEAAVALAIFLNFYNNFSTIDVERAQNLKG
jgi:NADH-quinone oxidoreductase subunit K